MSTDDVLLLRCCAHFYIDKVCGTIPFTYQHNTGRYRNALLFKQNTKKIFDTFTIKQNAKKVPETKKDGRRRTSQYVEALLIKVYDVLYFIISRTRRKYRRRRRSTDGVLQVRRGIHDEVYDALHFTNRRTRRRYQRRRERANGVLLLRRGPLDEVYDALYAFCPSLD